MPDYVNQNGFDQYNTWGNSKELSKLYNDRVYQKAVELDCHAQYIELLTPYFTPGDSVLDAGCGTGYLRHSFAYRDLPVNYWGVDITPQFIESGRTAFQHFGYDHTQLITSSVLDISASVDHVACINLLSNLDNYHRPLERLLRSAKKTVIIRESITSRNLYQYVEDHFLDTLEYSRVHVNQYSLDDICRFIQQFGFTTRNVIDNHSQGRPQLVIGYPHWWSFVVATRS